MTSHILDVNATVDAKFLVNIDKSIFLRHDRHRIRAGKYQELNPMPEWRVKPEVRDHNGTKRQPFSCIINTLKGAVICLTYHDNILAAPADHTGLLEVVLRLRSPPSKRCHRTPLRPCTMWGKRSAMPRTVPWWPGLKWRRPRPLKSKPLRAKSKEWRGITPLAPWRGTSL